MKKLKIIARFAGMLILWLSTLVFTVFASLIILVTKPNQFKEVWKEFFAMTKMFWI